MAKRRKQKRSRSIATKQIEPIVNIADRRSKRASIQEGRKETIYVAGISLNRSYDSSMAVQFARAMNSNAVAECPFRFIVHTEDGKRTVAYARNSVVKTFLEETDADWLLMIDDDETVPDNFWQLCTVTNADIVTAIVPVWVANMDPEAMLRINSYGIDEKGRCFNLPVPPVDLQTPYRIPVAGTGAIAIRRRVFAPKPYGLGPAPFFFRYSEDGRVEAGEDVNFSVAANRQGFVVAAHPAVRFDHLKRLPLWQVYAFALAYHKMMSEGKQLTEEQRISVG